MKIGVIGSSGKVAKGVIELLLKVKEYSLVLGVHRDLSMVNVNDFPQAKVSFLEVDVYSEESLWKFCSICDGIINCAGPSASLQARVANVCTRLDMIYVDVSGGQAAYNEISTIPDFDKRCLSIISAGIYPGLTEIFAAYIAAQYTEPVMVKEFFWGNSELSFNAAYDIVSSLEKDEGTGLSYCHNGKIEKIHNISSVIKFPFFDEEIVVMPFINSEYASMSRKNKIQNGYFYNTFRNNQALIKFSMLKALKQYKTEEEKSDSAQKIITMFQQEVDASVPRVALLVASEGMLDECKMERKDVLISDYDWNQITGYIAAIAMLYAAEYKRIEKGLYYACDIVDPEYIINKLVDLNIMRLSSEGAFE